MEEQQTMTDSIVVETASNAIVFNYCQVWDYTGHVKATIEAIEKKHKGKFNYFLFADPPNVKGRLEVTLFKGATQLETCS